MKTIKIKTAIAAAIITVCALGTTVFAAGAFEQTRAGEASMLYYSFSLTGKGDAEYTRGYVKDENGFASVHVYNGNLTSSSPMLFSVTTQQNATSYITKTFKATTQGESVREQLYYTTQPKKGDTIYLRGASEYNGCRASGKWNP